MRVFCPYRTSLDRRFINGKHYMRLVAKYGTKWNSSLRRLENSGFARYTHKNGYIPYYTPKYTQIQIHLLGRE